MKIMYRIGKKVGLIRYDITTNREYIDSGVIVARKIQNEYYSQGKTEYTIIYAIRFKDGRIEKHEHEELWTKFVKDSEYERNSERI